MENMYFRTFIKNYMKVKDDKLKTDKNKIKVINITLTVERRCHLIAKDDEEIEAVKKGEHFEGEHDLGDSGFGNNEPKYELLIDIKKFLRDKIVELEVFDFTYIDKYHPNGATEFTLNINEIRNLYFTAITSSGKEIKVNDMLTNKKGIKDEIFERLEYGSYFNEHFGENDNFADKKE